MTRQASDKYTRQFKLGEESWMSFFCYTKTYYQTTFASLEEDFEEEDATSIRNQ